MWHLFLSAAVVTVVVVVCLGNVLVVVVMCFEKELPFSVSFFWELLVYIFRILLFGVAGVMLLL